MARAAKADFPLDSHIPFPPELSNSLEWIKSTDPSEIVEFWDAQLTRLRSLVSDSEVAQRQRDALVSPELAHLGRRFDAVSFHHILRLFP